MHQELDSSDIFGYLHGSVSNATPTSLRSTTGERGIDWSHQTFSSSSSPSGLLARVSRKRQKIEHEAAADGDCFVVSATKPASEPLLLHEFRVTEDSKAPGREKRGKKELLKKVLPKRGNSPPPTIASQFFERGRPERLENETWYRGLGTVEGIAALKEALARAELEAPALVWGAQLRGAPSSGNRQDVLTALGSLSQPEPSNGYWRPLACNSFLTADESETCSSPLGWWLLCPELPSSKCSGNAVSARLFLSPDEVLKCLHARTSDPHQGVDIPPVRQTFEWRTVSGSELRRRKKKVDRANFKLQIQCNRDDPCAEQPPHFREFPLRKEQLRSLWWMQQQEKANTLFELTLQRHRVDPFNPAQVIPPAHVQAPQHRELHWQIEVVHRAFYNIRGGILGDAPGYGKTATTIGLVDAGVEGPPEIPSDQQPYFFHSKASLVLVPSNLLEQWLGEIQKFTAGTMKVIAIKTVANLKSLTVAQLCDAALVLCSYRLLYSKVYRHRLQQLAGLALAVETTDQATTETGPVDLRSLRRNTRRFREDVRSLLWGEEINDPSQLSFPVLEQLWWRRIVLDEFHELEAMGNTAQFESLRSIHAHYRWGLTGTPPTRDLSQVATLAQIFHLGHLPLEEKPPSAYRTDLAQEMCQHFLDHFARQNTSEEVTPVPLKEHILVVDPTPEERAIYLQCSRDVSDASGALTDEDRAERLIKLCSHFAAYCGLATAAADATGECHRIISTKQEHAKKTYNVALQRAVQLELLWQRLDAAQYRHSDQQDVCRSLGVDSAELGAAGAEGDAKVAEVGTWTLSRSFSSPVVSLAATVLLEASRMPPGQLQRLSGKPLEISDLASAREAAKGRMVSAAQTALSAQRSVEFFKRTLAAARGEASAEQRSCSICLEEDLTEDQLSITVCAHVFHTDCLNEVVKHFGTCPVCRHGLTGKNKVTSLAAELAPALPAVRSDKGQKRRLSSDTSETSKKAGSKLAALAVHLQSISAGEKVLVFCQWEDLKKHISDTLQSMGVPHFQLIGNLFQRAEILRRFQEESHESAVRVLLLSLEHAASGTNLTAANHVVFVHPMHAASPEKAVAYEAQAIARCRRYGQEKTVHCWRLVARGTIEETITATHQKDLWQDHVARSAPTSGGA